MLYVALVSALGLFSTPELHGRRLSYTEILTYAPGSKVTDHANIDLDQKALESAMSVLPAGFASAKDIYTTGAHSKPAATCTLVSPAATAAAISKGDAVTFVDHAGQAAAGKAYDSYAAGATSVRFTYSVSSMQVQPTATQCYVGGLPAGKESVDGCIAGSAGSPASGSATESTFLLNGVTYTATCTNRGHRTLQGFSTKAEKYMYNCPVDTTVSYPNGCPYTSYKPFYDYYGAFDYANQIVLAALDGTAITTFTNGALDFTSADDGARKEHIKKGTAYMNAWMYAIREFEDAIDDCVGGDLTANALSSGPVHAWDEGVAFYVGSLMNFDDLLAGNLPKLDSAGKLAYTLGNKRCKNYVTCGPDGDAKIGEAKANTELFELFREGQYHLLAGNCAKVVPVKDKIVQKMTIPLIQGTLRYAYKMAALSGGSKEKAEGSIFAAAVLPLVHNCSVTAAKTVYDSMNNGAASVDYMGVKAAFEGCYGSMGVTCADIGGLWNSAIDGYYNDAPNNAAPCVDPESSGAGGTGAMIGIIIAAAIAGLCSLLVIFMMCKERSGTPIFKPMGAPKQGA